MLDMNMLSLLAWLTMCPDLYIQHDTNNQYSLSSFPKSSSFFDAAIEILQGTYL